MKFKSLSFAIALVSVFACVAWSGASLSRSTFDVERSQALAGIARLHQEDIQATLTQNPDQLTNLWTDDAVVMEEGEATVVGKQAIHADLLKSAARNPAQANMRNRYTPHIEDVQIVGNTAYEWGYFDAASSDSHGHSTKLRGRLLRVLRRLPNGEWKFARVMWNLDHK